MSVYAWLKKFFQRRLAELQQAPPYPLGADEWADAPEADELERWEKKPSQHSSSARPGWQYLKA